MRDEIGTDKVQAEPERHQPGAKAWSTPRLSVVAAEQAETSFGGAFDGSDLS